MSLPCLSCLRALLGKGDVERLHRVVDCHRAEVFSDTCRKCKAQRQGVKDCVAIPGAYSPRVWPIVAACNTALQTREEPSSALKKMTRELIQEMMSVIKHTDPVARTNVTAAAQSDVKEPLEKLTQAIIALTAQIQSLENHFIMAQTARIQTFDDQTVKGLSARIMQAVEDQITTRLGASSDPQAPVEPLAQMVQCEGNDGALSNSQADEMERRSPSFPWEKSEAGSQADGQECPSPPSRLVKPESPTVPVVRSDFSKPKRKRARYS